MSKLLKTKRVGEKWLTKEKELMVIVKYISCQNVQIKTPQGRILKNINYHNLKRGQVKNPYHPSVYGVGYIGVGKYSCKDEKIYRLWSNMIKRCYYKPLHIKNKSYTNAKVCKKWHNLQNFAEWYEVNRVDSWNIDKSMLHFNNNLYSPEMCILVPKYYSRISKSSEKKVVKKLKWTDYIR